MFIELTDHLICPAAHEEQYLVLLPGTMEGRRVVTGELGCPVCGRIVRVREGVVEFDSAPPVPSPGPSPLSAEAVTAFLALSGPGGFVALAGAAAPLAGELIERIPGVSFILVNPPSGTSDSIAASVVRAPRLPLKSGSLRGVVLGADVAAQPGWVADAVRVVLPGLRVVAEGVRPSSEVEVLGWTANCWVGRKQSARGAPRSDF